MRKLETDKPKRKSRARFECPAKLEMVLELIAGLPLELELRKNLLPSTIRKRAQTEEQYAALINEATDYLSPLAQDYAHLGIFGKKGRQSFEEMFLQKDDAFKYETLWRIDTILRLIAYGNSNGQTTFITEFSEVPPPLLAYKKLKDGRLKKIKEPLQEAFDEGLEEAPDPSRIRVCKICNKVFWAKTVKSETCSKPCLNVWQQRKHREKNKEEMNARRRQNYKQKKKVQQLKLKNGGSK